MRTCCLKLQPGGKPGCMEQPWQQLCIWMEASCPGGMTHAQYCYTLSGSWLQLAKPPLHSSQSISIVHPKIHSDLSQVLSKLPYNKDGAHCFPDIISWHDDTTGTSFLDFLSPQGFQPNISMFLKNCWQQEGSITGSTPTTSIGYVSSLCHLLVTCTSSLTSQPQFHLSLKESS